MSDLAARIAIEWSAWMAPVACQALVLAALAWTIDRCTRRRLWTEVRFALWMIVIARLVVPPSWTSPTSVMALAHDPTTRSAMRDSLAVPFELSGSSSHSFAEIACAIWIAGIALCAMVEWRRHRRFVRELGRESQPASLPHAIAVALERAAKRMNVERVPAIHVSRHFTSPAVHGVLRPRILLPETLVADVARRPSSRLARNLEHALLHELAHVRRRDLLAAAIVRALSIVYWFHPAVWVAQRELAALREIACDATVSQRLRERTIEYRDALLDSARSLVGPQPRAQWSRAEFWHAPSTLIVRLEALERPLWKFARGRRIAATLSFALAAVFVLPAAPRQELGAPEIIASNSRSPITASSGDFAHSFDARGDVGAALANLQRFAEGGSRQSCLRLQYSAMLLDASGALAELPRE